MRAGGVHGRAGRDRRAGDGVCALVSLSVFSWVGILGEGGCDEESKGG